MSTPNPHPHRGREGGEQEITGAAQQTVHHRKGQHFFDPRTVTQTLSFLLMPLLEGRHQKMLKDMRGGFLNSSRGFAAVILCTGATHRTTKINT